jgi:hypothetical protein
MSGTILPHSHALPLVSKPPVESFFEQAHAYALWPKSITSRTDFRKQIQNQQALVHAVQTVFTALPCGTTLAKGLEEGLVTEDVASNLLNHLSHYLKADPAYERIIFYLPLEFTSPIESKSAQLTVAAERFQKTYREAWKSQMRQHDVRANFVDGDVLEVEKRSGDLPRVVKATHLIPGLVQSGHLTFKEVVQYAYRSSDELLKHGVIEACAVMLDMKLIKQSDLEHLRHSADPYLQSGYRRLLQHHSVETSEEAVSVEEVHAALLADIAEADAIAEQDATQNRLLWLRSVATEKTIFQAASKLSALLSKGAVAPDPRTLDIITMRAYVEAVRLVILHEKQLGETYRAWLDAVEKVTTDTAVLDTITKLYRHASTAGILNNEELALHGIHIPTLEGQFSKNLNNFTPSMAAFEEMIETISQDPYLTSRVYPVTILLGSQLKGYGISTADADVAVFIKPGTAMADSQEIAERLRHIFSHERIGGSAIMFWLGMVDNKLVIIEDTQTTGMPPLNSWAHILMGGAWIGEVKYLTNLQHDLLTPFLFNPTIIQDGKPARERWLEEMERDSILYRLLHKGYQRYYPVRSPFNTDRGSEVDGRSAFYDPMFRRIATLLFLMRVFFPNLDV